MKLKPLFAFLLILLVALNPQAAYAQPPDGPEFSPTPPTGLPIQPTPPPEAREIKPQLEKIVELFSDVANADRPVRVIVKYRDDDFRGLPKGFELLQRFTNFPFLVASAPLERLSLLAETPGVVAVYPDAKVYPTWLKPEDFEAQFGFKPQLNLRFQTVYPFLGSYPTLLNESTSMIGARKLWEQGITGEGVVVAVLDTGVDGGHPNLDDVDDNPETDDPKIIASVSMVPGEEPVDDIAHGTMVAGILAGTGAAGSSRFFSSFFGEFVNATILPQTQSGVAPGARILNVKVISSQGFGFNSWIIAGIDWAVENGADVINMSFGGISLTPEDPVFEVIREAVERGVVVVTSGGNRGPGQFSVSTPGTAPAAISVGIAYETGTLVYFSSRGPTPFGVRSKPDLIAPGAAIVSVNPFYKLDEGTMYLEGWGSSFAAPHVSGAVALLLQAFPGASPYAIKAALMRSAQDLGLDSMFQGAGLVNVTAAYRLLLEAEGEEVAFEPPERRINVDEKLELLGVNVLFTGDVGNFTRYIDLLQRSGARVTLGGPEAQNLTLALEAPEATGVPRNGVDRKFFGEITEVEVSASGVVDDYIDEFFLVFLDEEGVWRVLVDEKNLRRSHFFFNSGPISAKAIRVKVTQFDEAGNPDRFNVNLKLKLKPLKPEPGQVWVVAQLRDPKTLTLVARDAKQLVQAGDLSLLFIGDDMPHEYDRFTRSNFGIGWNPLGFGVGGESTRLESHPITEGLREVFLGGPLSSLEIVEGGAARAVLYDPVFPALAAWVGVNGGRVAVLADDDVLNNRFLDASENAELGVNVVKWLSGPFEGNFTVREVSLRLVHPTYILRNSNATLEFTAVNLGSQAENVTFTVTVLDASGEVFLNQTERLVLKEGESRPIPVGIGAVEGEALFTTFTVNASLVLTEANVTELSEENNRALSGFAVIEKTARAGLNPALAFISPGRITSFTPPHIAMFPGDFNVLNLTVIASGPLVDAELRVEGEISRYVSFSTAERLDEHRELNLFGFQFAEPLPHAFNHGPEFAGKTSKRLGNFTGIVHAPIQLEIPPDSKTGELGGKIVLYNSTTPLAESEIKLTVKTPKARILYDDVFDLFVPGFNVYLDAEWLWGGINLVFPGLDFAEGWRQLALKGYDVDSLRQTMFDASPKPAKQTARPTPYGASAPSASALAQDPWTILINARGLGYSAIIIHDKEMHSFRTAAWPKILRSGVSLITNFDADFPAIFPFRFAEIAPESIVNFAIIRNLNDTNPVSRGLSNVTFFAGVTLGVPERAQALATAADVLGAPVSGVVAAEVRLPPPVQAKQIAVGDSNYVDFLGVPDITWLFFSLIANVTVERTDTASFLGRIADYATNSPPKLNVSAERGQYGLGDTVTLRVESDKEAEVEVRVIDPRGGLAFSEKRKLGGEPAIFNVALKADSPLGAWRVEARAVDEMGDVEKIVTGFRVVDSEPPQIILVQPKPGQDFERGVVTVAWVSSDRGGSGLKAHLVRVDGGEWINLGISGSFVVAGLEPGLHTVSVRAVDGVGLLDEVEARFTVGKRAAEEALAAVREQLESLRGLPGLSGGAGALLDEASSELEASTQAFEAGSYGEALSGAEKALHLLRLAERAEQSARLAKGQAAVVEGIRQLGDAQTFLLTLVAGLVLAAVALSAFSLLVYWRSGRKP